MEILEQTMANEGNALSLRLFPIAKIAKYIIEDCLEICLVTNTYL